jgi:hypothetical protein
VAQIVRFVVLINAVANPRAPGRVTKLTAIVELDKSPARDTQYANHPRRMDALLDRIPAL